MTLVLVLTLEFLLHCSSLKNYAQLMRPHFPSLALQQLFELIAMQ